MLGGPFKYLEHDRRMHRKFSRTTWKKRFARKTWFWQRFLRPHNPIFRYDFSKKQFLSRLLPYKCLVLDMTLIFFLLTSEKFFLGGQVAGSPPLFSIYRLLRCEIWPGSLKMFFWITWAMFRMVPTSRDYLIGFFRPMIPVDVGKTRRFLMFLRFLCVISL